MSHTSPFMLLIALAALVGLIGCPAPAPEEPAPEPPPIMEDIPAPETEAPADETAELPASDEAATTEETTMETITTDSGLQYQDLTVGDGAEAITGATVIVHYVGRLEDGTQFDSSVDKGVPFDFPLGGGRVIAGWDEGVQGMKVGGKRKLTIPADLAYGKKGSPPKIPPNAPLVFEIELLEIEGKGGAGGDGAGADEKPAASAASSAKPAASAAAKTKDK